MGTVYVVDNKDEGIEIMDEGFISHDNVAKMRFTFSPGQDITESINKKNSRTRQEVSATKKGRLAYSSLTCHYPDKNETSKIMLTDCIVQYREGVDRPESNYATDYVSIGIPTEYMAKMMKDAKNNSSINIGPKDKVKRLESCYWLDCQLDNLSEEDTWVIYTDENGEDTGATGTIRSILQGMKSSLTASIMFTCSGSMSNDKLEDQLDLKNGKYTFTMKPTEMFVTGVSNKVGPVLEDTTRRKKESTNKSDKLKASKELAEYAMRKMNIQG